MPRDFIRPACLVLVLTAVGFAPTAAVSPQSPATASQRFNPRDQIPFDRVTHEATLPNGLRYFVRQNGRPEKRVSLRLVVKSGSIE